MLKICFYKSIVQTMNFYDGVYLVLLIHLKLRRIINRKNIELTNHIHLHENIRENSEFFV